MYANLLQEMSNIGRVRFREVSATWRFCYDSLTVISSVPEKSVLCREVSAIKDVRYKEVSLYWMKIRPCKETFVLLRRLAWQGYPFIQEN